MAATKIMFIRHGEKPTENNPDYGIDKNGRKDDEELTVRGWQRAGALARFFLPRDGFHAGSPLETPDTLVAPAVTDDHSSKRAKHTLQPLAALLDNLPIQQPFARGDEDRLGDAFAAMHGVVLVAWEHEAINDIIVRATGGVIRPPCWPASRFDMVYVLTAEGGWRLQQWPQLLLAGDVADSF